MDANLEDVLYNQEVNDNLDSEQEMMYGYTIQSDTILDAWARYRPDYSVNPFKKKSKKEEREESRKELNTIWSESFINNMLRNVHYKIYDFKGTESEKKLKRNFKDKFIKPYRELCEEEELLKAKRMNQRREDDSDSDSDDPLDHIPGDEVQVVKDFL